MVAKHTQPVNNNQSTSAPDMKNAAVADRYAKSRETAGPLSKRQSALSDSQKGDSKGDILLYERNAWS